MKYEILDDNGNVINTIIADEAFVKEHYPGRYRAIPEPPPPPVFIITKLAMISRFTNAEYVGVVAATKTDAAVQAWYDTFQAASKVDLKDQRCIDGVNFLVSKNLLTADRANLILTTPALPNETTI